MTTGTIEALLDKTAPEVITLIAQNSSSIRAFHVIPYRLDGGGYHLETDSIEIGREDVSKGEWLDRIPRRARFPFLGLSSAVETIYGTRHIPMLDLDGKCNSIALELRGFLSELRMPEGLILVSGYDRHSPVGYHYLGLNLFSQDEFSSFPERVRLVEDRRLYRRSSMFGLDQGWIRECHNEGHWILRLNAGAGKPVIPHVVGIFNP